LVEIGGSFRIPDIIEKSGAVMREVGTTNRTHLNDYERGVNSGTAAILYAHTSNYRVEGFTKEVSVAELANVSKKRRIPLIVDLGSGALFDLSKFSLPSEPVVRDVINSGAGLVTFSGDKLLGGPQTGLVCGKKSLISKLHKNPIYRALRCDKITLALLERTLRSYTDGSPNRTNLAHKLLTTPRSTLRRRGQKLLASLPKATVRKFGITVVDSMVEAGSGSLPVESIESVALRFDAKNVKPTELAKRFRTQDFPVVGYIKGNRFTIDLKAVLPAEMKDLSDAIQGVAK
jgi:L-seryl-tRNA(Ser) seleniumtransferase